MTTSEQILVAGDWHGNAAWAYGVIRRLPELLPQGPRLILHCGDFGIWPGRAGERYLYKVDWLLAQADARLWFVDGNHEDHDRLDALPRTGDGLGRVTDRISHLPRGHRWDWHGRTWLALGGAASPDRARRTEGETWWPQEEISTRQAGQAMADGPAEVMLTHDCPADVTHTFPPAPSWWDPADLKRSDRHRRLLQDVVDTIRPRHLIHGHLHRSYTCEVAMRHGPVHVTGLDCDGTAGNWAVLDAVTMRWGRRQASIWD